MRNIFIGLLFIFLDFNLDFGASRVGLIPDFIGYIMVLQGLRELCFLNERFAKAKPFTVGMIVLTSVLYTADLFGVWMGTSEIVGFVLGLISVGLSLYISYNIVVGIKNLEVEQARTLEADKLYSVWKLMAIFSVITYVLLIVPVLAIVAIIASIVIGIVFLDAFSKTKNLYYT